MRAIFLIIMVLSLLQAEFTRRGDVVIDNFSELEWQDEENDSTMSWEESIAYCENLTLNDKDDWRLPSKNELLFIVDYSKSLPAIRDVFKNTNNNYYWSSTTSIVNTADAIYIDFQGGSTGRYGKSNPYFYARCVRTKL